MSHQRESEASSNVCHPQDKYSFCKLRRLVFSGRRHTCRNPKISNDMLRFVVEIQRKGPWDDVSYVSSR